MSLYEIDSIGGNCPVQAEGTVGDEKWYFHARGDQWAIGIHEIDPVGAICEGPGHCISEDYGKWPQAGWMSEEKAKQIIDTNLKLYIKGKQT